MSETSDPSPLNGSLTTSHSAIFPLYRPTSVAMWLVISLSTAVAVGNVVLFTKTGSWFCHTRLWPRMRMLFAWANATTWSAGPQCKLFCEGSTDPHFISFSGVTELNWAAPMLAYGASADRWFAANADPILIPLASAAARSVVAASAGWTRTAATIATTSMATIAAARTHRPARGPWPACVSTIVPTPSCEIAPTVPRATVMDYCWERFHRWWGVPGGLVNFVRAARPSGRAPCRRSRPPGHSAHTNARAIWV